MSKRRRRTTGPSTPVRPTGRPPSPAPNQRGPGGAGRRDPRSKRRPSRRSPARVLILPVMIGAAVVAAVVAIATGPATAPRADALPAVRPVLGDPTAPVVIAEYGDFQCPSCGAFARIIEPQIRAAFVDTGIARLEWHDFPWIGQESRDAANAARCAGDQGRFWEFHDLLYRNQSGENQGAFSKDRLKAMGAQLGLDPTTFNACIDSNGHAGAVQADFADARAKGLNGTPTFFVGRRRIVGAQPFEVFQAAVDAERSAN